MRQFTITTNANNSDSELTVNVWEPSKFVPEGQVELYTTRGRSVTMTGREFIQSISPILSEILEEDDTELHSRKVKMLQKLMDNAKSKRENRCQEEKGA